MFFVFVLLLKAREPPRTRRAAKSAYDVEVHRGLRWGAGDFKSAHGPDEAAAPLLLLPAHLSLWWYFVPAE